MCLRGGHGPENDAGRKTARKGLANGDGMVIIRMFESQITEVQGSLVGPPDFKSGVSSRGDGWVRFPCTSANVIKSRSYLEGEFSGSPFLFGWLSQGRLL